jgi:FlaA1/EpsC-like NDP-sugar epimerase/EAL domain-containing protein (putative c-di-GMP-specific phosphodiesterase class I)
MKLNKLGNKLLNLNNRHFFVLDAIAFLVTPLLSMFLRLDSFTSWERYQYGIVTATIIFLIAKLSIFTSFGLYKRYWRYASIEELIQIAAVTMAAVVTEIIILSVLEYVNTFPAYFVPRSLPLLDGILSFILVGGIRFSVRAVEKTNTQTKQFCRRDRSLIVGAGNAGVSMLQEIQRNPKLGLNPVAFIDDNPQKLGLSIRGVPVVGNRYQLPEIVAARNIRQVVIAMPTASGRVIRDIVDICQAIGIKATTMPGMNEILSNSIKPNSVRDVNIEDLLRREPIQTDAEKVFELIEGKKVLITGAGGSIGSELCRQIFRCRPSAMILVGHGENSVFNIRQELEQVLQILRQEESDRELTELIPFIADLRFRERLEFAFKEYRPDIVFHAAAHKHVPLMELNPPEAITNNVIGTKNLVELALDYDVKNFVMISTDKAVNPTNVMGASKRVAEMLVLKAALQSKKPFVVVRFGNVLGSRGSVVPTFKQQIAKGGPITITHPEVCRYFMTIPEAVQLVLQASIFGDRGQIFMLNMGQPVKIVDLAKDLIRLSGYEVGKDIEIIFTGLRPGEKLYEELLIPGEEYDPTPHKKLLVVKNASKIIPEHLNLIVNILRESAVVNDANLIIFLLDKLVAGYNPQYNPIEVDRAQRSLVALARQAGGSLGAIANLLEPGTVDEKDLNNYLTNFNFQPITTEDVESGLRKAIEDTEFCLYYQPVINLQTGEIKEFEALLRWHHPQFGSISPIKFIAIAEQNGSIVPIGRWIVEEACRQLKTWQQELPTRYDWGISINIPSQQLLQPNLVKYIQYSLDRYNIEPHRLKLEISEHLISENPHMAMIVIPQLRAIGIQLQIDNFGKIASIYGYLQPNILYDQFNRVKIDRHLVSRIDRDPESWEILSKIAADINHSGLEVVATGIETEAQLDRLKEINCDYGQGYFFSRPMAGGQVQKMLVEQA